MDDVWSYSLFSRLQVPNDLVGCVGCKGHKEGVELSNEIVDVLDFVFSGMFSTDCDPLYKTVHLRNYTGLDNDLSPLCCPS